MLRMSSLEHMDSPKFPQWDMLRWITLASPTGCAIGRVPRNLRKSARIAVDAR